MKMVRTHIIFFVYLKPAAEVPADRCLSALFLPSLLLPCASVSLLCWRLLRLLCMYVAVLSARQPRWPVEASNHIFRDSATPLRLSNRPRAWKQQWSKSSKSIHVCARPWRCTQAGNRVLLTTNGNIRWSLDWSVREKCLEAITERAAAAQSESHELSWQPRWRRHRRIIFWLCTYQIRIDFFEKISGTFKFVQHSKKERSQLSHFVRFAV